jgi:hypothetical protein
MITDKPPRTKALKEEYSRSDLLDIETLPPADPLRRLSEQLEQAMKNEDRRVIELTCNAIATCICDSFDVPPPTVRVLGVRPLDYVGNRVDETFGDYTFKTARIRLWMRTAVLEKMTAFGTLLSTLCHEICHHLDVVHYDLDNTFHTRGFYNRAGVLYHHVRGTPIRTLAWDDQNDGTYRINWPKPMRGAATPVLR